MNRYRSGQRAELLAVRQALLDLFGRQALALQEIGTRTIEVAGEKQAAATP